MTSLEQQIKATLDTMEFLYSREELRALANDYRECLQRGIDRFTLNNSLQEYLELLIEDRTRVDWEFQTLMSAKENPA